MVSYFTSFLKKLCFSFIFYGAGAGSRSRFRSRPQAPEPEPEPGQDWTGSTTLFGTVQFMMGSETQKYLSQRRIF